VATTMIHENFTLEDLLLQPDHPEKEYRARPEKTGIYWGQRKLLLAEIFFLTHFYLPLKNSSRKTLLIYAGAAEGQHFRMIRTLFPDLDLVLYDPRPFAINPDEHTQIYQELFTDRTAEYWSRKTDRSILFISDIRSADWTRLTGQETEEEVLLDMRSQERWYEIIQPEAGFLKFRLPFSGKGVRLEVEYLDGAVLIQPYPPLASTETRLIPLPARKVWDALKYEQQLFYHNSVVRETFQWPNYALDPPELNGSYDTSSEIYILTDYLTAIGVNPDVEGVVQLSRDISADLGGTLSQRRKTRR